MNRSMLTESIIIGIVVATVGIILSKLTTKESHPRLDSPYFISMALCFAGAGIAVHLLFEYTGINKKFCETLLRSRDSLVIRY